MNNKKQKNKNKKTNSKYKTMTTCKTNNIHLAKGNNIKQNVKKNKIRMTGVWNVRVSYSLRTEAGLCTKGTINDVI